ncbi:hypothetical protein G6F24_014003 [Rhizopus arrhizus]|nr:hypothetical protein G6F24_014003 [Rhizopus arrhizus]
MGSATMLRTSVDVSCMRLLVIEDNRQLVANLFAYFESRGHVLDVAPDGITGLHLAGSHPYDAVIPAFLLGVGVWLAPLGWALLHAPSAELQAYAHELLFKQTGTRYANAWHHRQPPAAAAAVQAMVAPPAPWRPPAVAAAGLGAAGAGVLQCQPGQARGLSAADAAGHGAGRRTAAAGPAAPAVRAPLPVRLQRGADAGHWRARRDADDRTPVGGGAAGAPGHA